MWSAVIAATKPILTKFKQWPEAPPIFWIYKFSGLNFSGKATCFPDIIKIPSPR